MTTGTKTVGSESSDYYFRKQWSGTDDPGAHAAENPYLADFFEVQQSKRTYCAPLDLRIYYPYLPCTESYPTGGTPEHASADNLKLKSLSKIVEEIRGHGLDLGNYVVEGKQTVEMAISTLKKFRCVMRSLKRGQFEAAARCLGVSARRKLSTKDISGQWLELMYGWLPLLSDVYEAGKAWEAATQEPRKWDFQSQASAPHKFTQQWGTELYTGNARTSVRVKVRLSENLTTPRSLGLVDPLGIAWEGIPWSFVVDWFYPIGTYLDVLSVLGPLDADELVNIKKKSVVSLTGYSDPYTHETGGVWIVGTRTIKHTVFERAYGASVNIPPPKVKRLEESLSKAHLYNAIALTRGLFNR